MQVTNRGKVVQQNVIFDMSLEAENDSIRYTFLLPITNTLYSDFEGQCGSLPKICRIEDEWIQRISTTDTICSSPLCIS